MQTDHILSINELKPEAVVVGNGDFPTHPVPLQVMQRSPYTVCCDGAADTYLQHGHTPDLIIGDGDSLSDENKRRYAHLLHCISEQETNDQTKAVTHLMQQGKKHIAIVGATGKREDHTLGNISLLIEYMRMGAEVRMYTDHGTFIPCQGVTTFSCQPGQQVSIFNFGTQSIEAEGLVYPLRNFTNWWQGTLNECIGQRFTIRAEGQYLVFLAYPDRSGK